jgi:hypothetical protein
MRVFVSAAPEARQYCERPYIEGIEVDVPEGTYTLYFKASLPPPSYTLQEAVPKSEDELTTLEASYSGKTYRGLPWWVIKSV